MHEHSDIIQGTPEEEQEWKKRREQLVKALSPHSKASESSINALVAYDLLDAHELWKKIFSYLTDDMEYSIRSVRLTCQYFSKVILQMVQSGELFDVAPLLYITLSLPEWQTLHRLPEMPDEISYPYFDNAYVWVDKEEKLYYFKNIEPVKGLSLTEMPDEKSNTYFDNEFGLDVEDKKKKPLDYCKNIKPVEIFLIDPKAFKAKLKSEVKQRISYKALSEYAVNPVPNEKSIDNIVFGDLFEDKFKDLPTRMDLSIKISDEKRKMWEDTINRLISEKRNRYFSKEIKFLKFIQTELEKLDKRFIEKNEFLKELNQFTEALKNEGYGDHYKNRSIFPECLFSTRQNSLKSKIMDISSYLLIFISLILILLLIKLERDYRKWKESCVSKSPNDYWACDDDSNPYSLWTFLPEVFVPLIMLAAIFIRIIRLNDFLKQKKENVLYSSINYYYMKKEHRDHLERICKEYPDSKNILPRARNATIGTLTNTLESYMNTQNISKSERHNTCRELLGEVREEITRMADIKQFTFFSKNGKSKIEWNQKIREFVCGSQDNKEPYLLLKAFPSENGLKYKALNLMGQIKRGKIPWKVLPEGFPRELEEFVRLDILKPYEESILNQINEIERSKIKREEKLSEDTTVSALKPGKEEMGDDVILNIDGTVYSCKTANI